MTVCWDAGPKKSIADTLKVQFDISPQHVTHAKLTSLAACELLAGCIIARLMQDGYEIAPRADRARP